MTFPLAPGRLAEIRDGQYAYRTSEQLTRDVADLLAEREQLLAELARGKDTAPRGESTPGPRAELRFAVHGPVPLLDPAVRDLPADHYGRRFRQVGGWLPDDWSAEVPRGTEYLEVAHVPGRVMPCEINVHVTTTATRDGSRYMAVEWHQERP
ncbi:hypothetical protein ACFUJR_27900 [Streptomyces sp. NPDC057271]|uniref:hypothetical protein n=1 Tax=unclassified Streptomyces TaxID=2593676 RepID=UPI003632D166